MTDGRALADGPALPGHRARPGRRAVLAGACAACAAVLTGCTTYDANNGFTPQSSAAAPASSASAAGTASAAATGSSAAATASGAGVPANALATTAQVPEGGGKIITGKNIVITQPEAGSFKAFSAICTHQGCIVGTVAGGTIDCPCHGSKFSIKDGSVVNGPATSPLPRIAITVEGTSIVKG
ncbi:MAG TPA: Rieske (2Fe-2S) protein [Trebonia sp.]